jgi:glycosyltransferase involved in cell wall biosynthesis
MKQPLISVVIPAYNVEKYIAECLNSVLHQTFQDWECIVVNDGSTDNTLAIIESFTAKDKRFSCYTIPNSGAAKIPLDTAVSYAKADWICVMGNDDFLANNALEKAYKRALDTKADIISIRVLSFDNANPNNFNFIPNDDFDMQQIITGPQAVMLTIPKWEISTLGALTKKKLWDARSMANSKISYSTSDEYDGREIILKANTVAFENVIYNYRRHAASISNKISTKLFEPVITDKMLEDLLFEYFGKESPQASIVSQYRMNAIIDRFQWFFLVRKKLSPDDRRKVERLIKKHYLDIDKKRVFRNQKIKRILCTNGYTLFRMSVYWSVFFKKY